MAFRPPHKSLLRVFRILHRAYGDQHWWPGDSPFEIMLGAVLTQNTAWTNVERAIAALKAAGALDARRLLELPEAEVAVLIRSAGYFNVKARRLRNFCRLLLEQGGEAGLSTWSTQRLREVLLGVNGIGPETADDMLLYAFGRPVFVIDAYTRRLVSRLGWLEGEAGYEELRHGFESALPAEAPLFNEYHALIVHHAKRHCRARNPSCDECPLKAKEVCEGV